MRKLKNGIICLVLAVMSGMAWNCLGEEKNAEAANKVQQVKSYNQLVSILEKSGYIVSKEEYEEEQVCCAGYASAPSESKTNVQVEGIDEAAQVQVDGRYIYSCTRGASVFIVDTQDQMKQVCSLPYMSLEYGEEEYGLEGESYYPIGLYVTKNQLIVILKGNEAIQVEGKEKPYRLYASGADVYDITDKTHPKLERKIRVEGELLTTRKIQDQLYLVTKDKIAAYYKGGYSELELLPIKCIPWMCRLCVIQIIFHQRLIRP